MHCSSGQYGVSDMQELMLAAGGATNHMFLAQQQGPHLHHHQHQEHQQQHHHYQQGLQQQEILDLYHRQAGLQQDRHISPPDLHGTHFLFGFHHLQQKALDFHLPLAHQMSHGSESSAEVAVSSLITARTTLTNHDHVTQYIQPLAASFRPVSTMDTAVEGYSDMGADHTEQGELSGSPWPRQETLTLLRIRSQMDSLFRDSSPKGSIWEEVSRKLYDVGYQRSAQQCKEKFENVDKYIKKAKDGKAGNQEGKTYPFYTELEAIYSASQDLEMEAAMASARGGSKTLFPVVANSGMQQLEGDEILPVGQETSTGPNSSSSTSCGNAAQAGNDEASEQQICGSKRKRSSWGSMRAFFDNLAKQLIERQDALHKKFLEAIQIREEERARREEAYKRQEMARMSREQDLRAREQALAATRDAALVAFLHKVTGETLHLPEMTPSVADTAANCNGGEATTPSGEEPSEMKEGSLDANNRRWPKVEVLALIRVRTSLEPRFQEAGPKAQLWEEVSSSMASLGFSRTSKRCKEKWENINKYYRKTKDNGGHKLRPEGATKTCSYFHQLELLYERGILTSPNGSSCMSKSASKLDGPQMSGEFLESTSKDESQQTSMNPDYQQGSSISVVHRSTNVQTTDDGRSMVMACSSNGAGGPFHNGVFIHDVNTGGDLVNSNTQPILPQSDQINVNCDPPQFNDVAHEHVHRHEEHMCDRASVTVLANEGTHFVREVLEVQHQLRQQPQRLPAEHLFERHQLIAIRNEHTPGLEMQNSVEGQDIEMRTHQEEEMSRLNHECAHRENATLMALVHKLASIDGHSDFDLSSPATPE